MTTHRTQDDADRTELLATRSPAASSGIADALAPGERMGRYRIQALLGRGGMGEVYRAEQLEPVRRIVALKLLRLQRLDARHLAYFEVERQLLAQMRHPAIAQIYDADTTDGGFPFFAMEYIDGSPLTAFCEQRRLPLRERLELFIRICEGVQHAHQKGVIHRDLKPGNILVDEVDGRPLPKIIDFGIATAASLAQEGGMEAAGTPDYMSPEQAGAGSGSHAGTDQASIDTRSDVYSLGVVLYELLTGARPASAGETVNSSATTVRLPSSQMATLAPGDAARIAQAQGLSVPGMRRMLRNELDWVVARAMRHDRAERYPSVAALADDLRRFLDDQPVLAVPSSRAYVWGRFARRHRGALLAAGVAMLALLGGLAMSLYGLQQARTQRAIAEQRSTELEKVAAFQQSMLQDIDIEAMGIGLANGLRAQVAKSAHGDGPALEQALAHASTADLARQLIDSHVLVGAEQAIDRDFSSEPALAGDLRASVARVRVALGLSDKAVADFAQVADGLTERLGPHAPATLQARQEQARALFLSADPESARQVAKRALTNATTLAQDDPMRLKLELVRDEAIAALGDRARASDLLQALYDRSLAAHGARDPLSMEILNSLAATLSRLGDLDAARKHMEYLVPLRREVLGPEHEDTLASISQLATIRAMDGDLDQALALQRQLVDIQSRRLGREHPVTLAARGNLATMLVDTGQFQKAMPEAKAVVEARSRVLGADHPMTMRAMLNLATLHARMEDYPQALALEEDVIDARTRVLGARHPDTASILVNHAGTLLRAGQAQVALAQLDTALPLARDVLGEQHRQMRLALMIRADALYETGDMDGAIGSYRELLDIRHRVLGARAPETIDLAWILEGVLAEAGQHDAAARLRATYITPLLQADPATLDKALVGVADGIRQDIRDEAAAADHPAGTQ